jgi:predicted amidohydrolase
MPCAGCEIVTFELGGRGGALICYDLRFPELFRSAVRRARTSSVTRAGGDAIGTGSMQARAIENLSYVVGVNRCGRDPQFYHSGRSAVVDPHGVIIANAGEGERVLNTRIEPEIVTAWRRDFPPLRDMGWREK